MEGELSSAWRSDDGMSSGTYGYLEISHEKSQVPFDVRAG